jgi:hypothetical protein
MGIATALSYDLGGSENEDDGILAYTTGPALKRKPSLEILEVKWKRAEISNECSSSDSCAKIKLITAESMTMDDFILSLAYQFLHSTLTVHYNNRETLPGEAPGDVFSFFKKRPFVPLLVWSVV